MVMKWHVEPIQTALIQMGMGLMMAPRSSSDAEVRNDLMFTAINGGPTTGFIPVLRQLPSQVKPVYLGAYTTFNLAGLNPFPYATGIAVDNSRIYLTAAA